MSFTSCIINSTLTDIPLIEEKNQFVASAGGSMVVPTFILTASYGLTNHVALQSKYAIDSIHTTLQQSIGYYWKLPERKNIEVYAGYAQGGGIEDSAWTTFANGDFGTYQLYFTQFNFGYTNPRGYATSGFSLKNGLVLANYTHYYSDWDEQVDGYVTKQKQVYSHGFFFSPTVYGKFGKKNLKVNVQAQLQFSLDNKIHYGFSSAPFNVGVSIQYTFRYKKPKSLFQNIYLPE